MSKTLRYFTADKENRPSSVNLPEKIDFLRTITHPKGQGLFEECFPTVGRSPWSVFAV